MSRDDIINRYGKYIAWVGTVVSILVVIFTVGWKLNGRITAVESGRAEREVIVVEMTRMKTALWDAHKRQGAELKALHIECAKNTMARSLLHSDIH